MTAVELLVEQVFGKNTNYYLQWKLEIEQALAMEKEQIENAYKRGKRHKKPLKDSTPITKFKSE